MRGFLKSPLFISLAGALLCATLMLTEVVQHAYWNLYYKHFAGDDSHASASSAIVSLDGGQSGRVRSIQSSTGEQTALLRVILRQDPAHVFFDYPASEGEDLKGDQALAKIVSSSQSKVSFVLRGMNDPAQAIGTIRAPRTSLANAGAVNVSAWTINFFGYAMSAPPVMSVGGHDYGAVASRDAKAWPSDRPIVPDYAIDPEAVAVVDAAMLLNGLNDGRALAGKTVYVTTTSVSADSSSLGSSVGFYGHSYVPAAVADIAGADAVRQGGFRMLGGLPLLALFCVLVLLGHRLRQRLAKSITYFGLLGLLLTLPAFLLDHGVLISNDLAFCALLFYVPVRAWQRWRTRLQRTNSRSGLPNIDALAADGVPDGYDVLAAAISQYEEMLANLPRDLHGECARQIARRLSVASDDSKVYVTDNGHFVWLEEPRLIESQIDHLEGLKALFAAPLLIGNVLLDTNIHFGLDRNSQSLSSRRIQAAMACASDALAKGKLYEEYAHDRLETAPWELSLHARIDAGLVNGDIWLALQAQYDMRSGRIGGAEALIRWNDPERGVIPPDAFILQAERAGRIEAITYWVLERSIEASKRLNQLFHPFHISVNLSARMADQPGLVERVAEIVERTGVDCTLITFEVTETFSMANRDVAKANLLGLRAMGFRLSIDDFGTGQASLAYLAEIPSDEIKLDKRFIQAITSDKRERLIVRTVIKLAHALGQDIVAEGVEDRETLDALRQMNCDIAQGYYIGRPGRIDDLLRLLGDPPVRQGLAG